MADRRAQKPQKSAILATGRQLLARRPKNPETFAATPEILTLDRPDRQLVEVIAARAAISTA